MARPKKLVIQEDGTEVHVPETGVLADPNSDILFGSSDGEGWTGVGVDEGAVVEPDVAFGIDTEPIDPLLAQFIGWSKGEEIENLQPFVEAGYLDQKYSLTDAAVELLDLEKIGWRQLYFLKLGAPVTLTDGTKINEGSSLAILSGGDDEKVGSKFWRCFAGDKFPILYIYQHRLHQFWDARYPLDQKMTSRYTNQV